MIQLFDVKDRTLIPTIHCYGIPFLKQIMEFFPDDYIDIYRYIFYLTCPDSTLNPTVNLPELEREDWILSEIKPKFWIEDMKICEAVEKCRKLYETPTLRLYIAAKKGVDKIAKFIDEEEITSGKEGNGMLYNTYMSKMSDYNKQYKDLEKDLEQEQAKVRGGAKIRYDQMPGYSDTKEDKDDKE